MKYTKEYKAAAYKMCGVCNVAKMTDDELIAANDHANDLRFYAQMSDDYRVTCKEIGEINNYMFKAREEMKKRGI